MRRATTIAILLVTAIATAPINARDGVTSCPGAIPSDAQPDDQPIQACLDGGGTVALPDGVYLITSTLRINRGDLVFTSESSQATLRAAESLYGPILETNGWINGFRILNLDFNGSKGIRAAGTICDVDHRGFGSNVVLKGSWWWFNDNTSRHALCGSALEVQGDNYQIINNAIFSNGYPQGSTASAFPYADGITLLSCNTGYVSGNYLEDNTDIDIVVGGGQDCAIHSNIIRHYSTYGFAGIGVHAFQEGGGNHPGLEVAYNNIFANAETLGFGINVGRHAWSADPGAWQVGEAGRTFTNTITGAVINLAIDGISSGEVTGNTLSGAQGSNGFGSCTYSSNYIAAHYGSANIQPGADPWWFDSETCGPI
jgi:hypothetical protein